MRVCCPLAACLKSRALLLWAAVLVPLGILVAATVSVELRDSRRAAGAACPAGAAGRDTTLSCQEMHLKLRPEASSAAGYSHDSCRYSHDFCPPPPAGPAAP